MQELVMRFGCITKVMFHAATLSRDVRSSTPLCGESLSTLGEGAVWSRL